MSEKDYEFKNEEVKEELETAQPETEPEVVMDDSLVNFEPAVKVNVKFDFKTLKYANLYITNFKRKAYITNIIFSAVALGLGVFTFIEGQWIFGIIFIALAIMTSVQIFTMEKRIDQELYKYFAKHRVGNQDVSLSDELIVLTRPEDLIHPVSYKWNEVESIHEINEFFYIFTNRNRIPIIIDKNPALMEVGTLEVLKSILDRKVKESEDLVASGQKKKAIKFVVVEKSISKIPVTYVHKDDAIETAVIDEEFKIKSDDLKIEDEKIETIVQEEETEEGK
ncbi:MAG: hypothetical protein WC278_02455 [Bacilli bacterium]|jgi:hypothetical protein|nr:hypothetical protein [Bacilli bacterium]MDD2681517.1 hypothetical protein [Bacilli bacterium]MDD3121050.1 hypothetical protein [Bacilli bacterium]MDD4063224.1 hypothetical protein [Bacilli bacterium]MDD4481864.1 hypothetical protein [Bacilli bacterium]